MRATLVLQKHSLPWIICMVLITTAGENIPCPLGSQVHLTSLRCYWLSEMAVSWFEARASCRTALGGDLAAAESLELQSFFLHAFPVKTTVWVWLQDSDQEGVVQPQSPIWWDKDDDSPGECTQMALGTLGRWRKAQCAGQYHFICEMEVNAPLPLIDSYLIGLALMTSIHAETQIQLLPSVPDIGRHTVEMQLFPGLWFSHAGQLLSVELVVQPSPVSSLARVQILRPYCNPNYHLVPPGCSSLLNPFSCCSAVPLCNTTGGCSTGQYWCHLLEACVLTTSPCSTYDSAIRNRGFALPPRYSDLPPFYHVVADLPLKINPTFELNTIRLPLLERAIMVYPDDIVAIQHTLDSGTFLHCLNSEASRNSPWSQSYLSFRGMEWGGWLEGGVTLLPQGSKWVDGVVCNLKMLYVDTLHRATEHEDIFDYTQTETATVSGISPLTTGPNPSLKSKFQLEVIHPLPDDKNQIHVQINIPTVIILKALFGEKASSSWSAPVLQTGVPFLPSCPENMFQSSLGCRKQSQDSWFSSATLVLSSPGIQILNISVMDVQSFQSLSVKVCGYEPVMGLSVEPHGCLRMLVDTSQSFTATVESGSSVKFSWVIDDLKEFTYEGGSYSVMFKKPAEYKLLSQQILLTADKITLLADPEFLSVSEVVAMDVTHLYTVRVRVDISLPVTFRWDFGDGSSSVIHAQPAPCQSMKAHVARREKQMYIQDSVNYSYRIPEDYTLHVQVSNQYDNTETSMKINVRPQLISLLISPSTLVPVVNQTFDLEASTEPSAFVVFYTWDFGDGSKAVQSIHARTGHRFGSAGVYNITVLANNTVSSISGWHLVVIMEKISGLTVSSSRSSEVGSATDFKAEVSTGTDLLWDFDFGDGSRQENLTDGSISHIYKFPGNYTVEVTVYNSVSKAFQSIIVEVYALTIRGVLPTECIMSGKDTQFTALVNGNISSLTFHWLFKDSNVTVVIGQSTAMHIFPSHGIFHVNLTVFSSFTRTSFNTSVCVQSPITNVVMQSSKNVVAVGEQICISVFVSPEQMMGYQFKWFSNSYDFAAVSENSERCFVFGDECVEEVSVTASNKVSNKTAKVNITIQKPVSGLSIRHNSQSDALIVNTVASFWIASCAGTNVSVLWNFGDGSPAEQKHNVSHVFTLLGQFTVTAIAFNSVSRDSTTLTVNVLLPVSDLSLHTSQPYSVVGEETVITAVSSAGISSASYFWTVEGISLTSQGTHEFRFAFPRPGEYRVSAITQNLLSKREADILIEAFERIEGLQIECQSLINEKYIPTHEEVLFTTSVTKGSNITFHWLARQSETTQQIAGEGELFHLLPGTPGNLSVQLRASNVLGEVTKSVSLVVVERVKNAVITVQSNFVAWKKVVNISIFVDTGSHLQYLWHMNANLLPLQTQEPFLLYTFPSLGSFLVKVVVWNAVSQSNNTKQFLVQEEVQDVGFQIDNKTHPFYVNASATLSFYGFIHKGNYLHWDWKAKTAKQNIFTSTSQTFIYRFPHAGTYQVYLNVSNGISWQMVSHDVTVQDAVKGLVLGNSKSSLCSNEQVTFIPTISKGSNVSFLITFQNKHWTLSHDIFEGQYTTSSLPVGRHIVTVQAFNQVSSAEACSSILITEQVQGLQLVNCCSTTLEAQKGTQFKAEVQSGFPVNYTWMFHLERSRPTWLMGKEVIFTPLDNGSLFVSVSASNGVCSQTINLTATVEWPVRKVKLVCHSKKIFVEHAVRFSATVGKGSNIKYVWDFGESKELLVTESSAVNHTYYNTGNYKVMVTVFNSVINASSQLHTEVEDLQCSSPQASLVQSQSTILRSRTSFFEASVNINCSSYKTLYLWEVFTESDCTYGNTDISGNKVILQNLEDATPFLSIPKHALNVGSYCLVFTLSFQETPILLKLKTNITVVHSPLVALIKGGSHRLWSSLNNLVLDGSDSYDPDIEPGVEDALQYHWTCMTMVTVSEAHLLPVTIECVSCSVRSSANHISYNAPVVLSGHCGQCDDQAQYKWRAHDQSGLSLVLDEVTTKGKYSRSLVVRSGILQPGQSYYFELDVAQPHSGERGSAILMIQTNNPPHGGLCDLSPESDIQLLETKVTYNCSGWQDDESRVSQLIYTFQVALCQLISTVCPVLTLYRGTQSTFSTLVPVGSPGQRETVSVIRVILLVENHSGAKAVALNRTLTVENPAVNEAASQWLRNKSQTELWALVQHGNPQEIIPYSIALTSKLNQMDFECTAEELMDRREIRENVTEALASLPVSTLLDVDQISATLSQSVAVPSELARETSQKKVLETVGKMIHVIEKETNPAVLSAADTGRNILNVIGSTLAAASESVSGFYPVYTGPLQGASVISLSALSHAGALMRTLMRSYVSGEVPFLLSTNYITSVGFQGDPSGLLCQSNHITRQSSFPDKSKASHHCQFTMPSSLIARLENTESEVVQVLFSLDKLLDANALLEGANPPISTTLVAMELSTPQGQPIPIVGLDPEQAIQVSLPNKNSLDHGNERVREDGNGTCLTVTLPTKGQLNFTVKVPDSLDENAGLYIAFKFTLAPGATPLPVGHVKIEASSAVPRTNASQDSLVREWALTLSHLASSSEETIFLSPLSLCQYYNVKERRWSREGLRPLEGSTLHTALCLTQHLTMFGASLFVHPGAVVLLPPSGEPVRNMVVGIICAALVLIHLLVGLIAHKLDHLDSLRLSQVPLCGRPGLYHYRVLVKTGWRPGAGTTAHVGISLYGLKKSGSHHLQMDGAFQRGSLDQFHVETDDNLGEVWKIRIWHDNTGLDPSWYVQHVVVWDPQTDHMFFFLLDDWLSVDNETNSTVEKEVLACCPEELTLFKRVFTSQLIFGMVDRHLWLSLLERPPHSCFTRGQRVTCGALMLHLYLALGALWYGAVGTVGDSGPISAHLLANVETVAVGMTVAVLVFPLQCFLCFLFRKAHSRVTVDMSVPPSPVCHSVEMDVFLGQSEFSFPTFLSLPDSSGRVTDSPSSLTESKALDSSILDFWAASGLAPKKDEAHQEDGIVAWPSCDSLLSLPAGSSPSKPTLVPDPCKASSARQLKRKKALMQLHLTPHKSPDMNSNRVQVHSHNLTTLLTLSEEDLLMSIEAADDTADAKNSNSDSGRDSPRTTSSVSTMWSTSCSSWSEHSEDNSQYGTGLYECPSVDSMASTFLPSTSPDSTCSFYTTRIGVARSQPGRLLPRWALRVIYPLLALLLGACLAVMGLYGSCFSRTVVLMWLVSALSAFLTSALLLEPLKVCVLALSYTVLWRPVDPEVEEQLAQEANVVSPFREQSGKVRPPCGYGLLQAKEEARRVQALQSIMRQCVWQLLFLLLVLMVNYQDATEQRQARLLHSTIKRRLHTSPLGFPNLTSLKDWFDTELWINHTLVPHLHQNPSLRLVGLPQLQYRHALGSQTVHLQSNNSGTIPELLTALHMAGRSRKQFEALSIEFTQYHRESALFLCVCIKLEQTRTQAITSCLSIHPLLIPLSVSGLDLQTALPILLLISALLTVLGELWSVATERAQYLHQCHHWFQLLLAFLLLTTAILQLRFLSCASSCVSQVKNNILKILIAGNLTVCAEVGCDRQSVAQSLEGAAGSGCPTTAADAALHSPWECEGFLSVQETSVSVLSFLHGRIVLQKICQAHPILGPLYGLLLMGGGVWVLARLCGAVLIHTYRAEQAELFHPTIKPQDYQMVEFFIKRLKLWMGLTKAKQFRHRVKFKGMDIPPSRFSQESCLSTLSSTVSYSRSPSLSSTFSSPCPLSSALSNRSKDSSVSELGFEVQQYLDSLLPRVTAMLSRFDRVNQISEDIYNLEIKLDEVQTRRRKTWINYEKKSERIFGELGIPAGADEGRVTGEVRHRKTSLHQPKLPVSLPSTLESSVPSMYIFPSTYTSYSEFESVAVQPQPASDEHSSEVADPTPEISALYSKALQFENFPRRRAWHSGSSHSADAAQRTFQLLEVSPCRNGEENSAFNPRPKSEEGLRRSIGDGIPVKRKAWISEGPETE
ncbi:polycystin-1 [Pelmatolapia mariae]|uniref:polycystin-1 n=1 Tax=Pelmatolapia mariae TaxID=158779 RepID=UPI002FE55A85